MADECGVICKLQELDREVFRGAVVGVQGEEWGENAALRGTSFGGAAIWHEFPLCQKAGDPLTDRARDRELG